MKKIIAIVVGVYVTYQAVSLVTAVAVAGINAGVETIRTMKMQKASKKASEVKRKGGSEIYIETCFTD